MKVKAICIDNVENDSWETYHLTIGKVYTITKPTETPYSPSHTVTKHCGLVDDAGNDIVVPNYFFKLIDKHRNDQIDQLLK